MRKFALRAVAFVIVAVFAVAAWDLATYDAAAWRRDYEHLKREMAQRYANLDWMVSHRGIDLKLLDYETATTIENAYSRVQAYFAFRRFIQTFVDPHLKIEWHPRPIEFTRMSFDTPAGPSCEDAGYQQSDHSFRFPFAGLDGWTALRDGHFPTGITGDLGVLRISSFGEDQYLAACRKVFRAGLGARTLRLAVRASLQQELTGAIDDLKARGARRLLVDVSGNGGGTEWVTDVVALLTYRDLVRPSSRHVSPQCDRSGIWLGESVCPVLAPPGEIIRLTGIGPWTGPLFILADSDTGSASEDFLAWLQQNKIATVLGARTAGAGCGYVNGGGRIELQTAPFDVMAPNCARFLNDGTNEIEGIAPDVPIPMEAAALAAALSAH